MNSKELFYSFLFVFAIVFSVAFSFKEAVFLAQKDTPNIKEINTYNLAAVSQQANVNSNAKNILGKYKAKIQACYTTLKQAKKTKDPFLYNCILETNLQLTIELNTLIKNKSISKHEANSILTQFANIAVNNLKEADHLKDILDRNRKLFVREFANNNVSVDLLRKHVIDAFVLIKELELLSKPTEKQATALVSCQLSEEYLNLTKEYLKKISYPYAELLRQDESLAQEEAEQKSRLSSNSYADYKDKHKDQKRLQIIRFLRNQDYIKRIVNGYIDFVFNANLASYYEKIFGDLFTGDSKYKNIFEKILILLKENQIKVTENTKRTSSSLGESFDYLVEKTIADIKENISKRKANKTCDIKRSQEVRASINIASACQSKEACEKTFQGTLCYTTCCTKPQKDSQNTNKKDGAESSLPQWCALVKKPPIPKPRPESIGANSTTTQSSIQSAYCSSKEVCLSGLKNEIACKNICCQSGSKSSWCSEFSSVPIPKPRPEKVPIPKPRASTSTTIYAVPTTTDTIANDKTIGKESKTIANTVFCRGSIINSFEGECYATKEECNSDKWAWESCVAKTRYIKPNEQVSNTEEKSDMLYDPNKLQERVNKLAKTKDKEQIERYKQVYTDCIKKGNSDLGCHTNALLSMNRTDNGLGEFCDPDNIESCALKEFGQVEKDAVRQSLDNDSQTTKGLLATSDYTDKWDIKKETEYCYNGKCYSTKEECTNSISAFYRFFGSSCTKKITTQTYQDDNTITPPKISQRQAEEESLRKLFEENQDEKPKDKQKDTSQTPPKISPRQAQDEGIDKLDKNIKYAESSNDYCHGRGLLRGGVCFVNKSECQKFAKAEGYDPNDCVNRHQDSIWGHWDTYVYPAKVYFEKEKIACDPGQEPRKYGRDYRCVTVDVAQTGNQKTAADIRLASRQSSTQEGGTKVANNSCPEGKIKQTTPRGTRCVPVSNAAGQTSPDKKTASQTETSGTQTPNKTSQQNNDGKRALDDNGKKSPGNKNKCTPPKQAVKVYGEIKCITLQEIIDFQRKQAQEKLERERKLFEQRYKQQLELLRKRQLEQQKLLEQQRQKYLQALKAQQDKQKKLLEQMKKAQQSKQATTRKPAAPAVNPQRLLQGALNTRYNNQRQQTRFYNLTCAIVADKTTLQTGEKVTIKWKTGPSLIIKQAKLTYYDSEHTPQTKTVGTEGEISIEPKVAGTYKARIVAEHKLALKPCSDQITFSVEKSEEDEDKKDDTITVRENPPEIRQTWFATPTTTKPTATLSYASLYARPNPIRVGEQARIYWQGLGNCSLSGFGVSIDKNIKNNIKTDITVTPIFDKAGNYPYILSCGNKKDRIVLTVLPNQDLTPVPVVVNYTSQYLPPQVSVQELANNTCPVFTKYLDKGDTHPQVKAVEEFLQKYGFFTGKPDFTFDEETKKAVEKFQQAHAEAVLAPWGLKGPTGRWYITTRSYANKLMGCRDPDFNPDLGDRLKR